MIRYSYHVTNKNCNNLSYEILSYSGLNVGGAPEYIQKYLAKYNRKNLYRGSELVI